MLYWCAIFCAIGFVYLFYFLEETNYRRGTVLGHEKQPEATSSPASVTPDNEKTVPESPDIETADSLPKTTFKRKNYRDKLKLWQASAFTKPNHLRGMVTRPLIFLSFPVIAYAGFSYGSNLVWFNVLNG